MEEHVRIHGKLIREVAFVVAELCPNPEQAALIRSLIREACAPVTDTEAPPLPGAFVKQPAPASSGTAPVKQTSPDLTPEVSVKRLAALVSPFVPAQDFTRWPEGPAPNLDEIIASCKKAAP